MYRLARPGRRKTAWTDNIKDWTDGGLVEARKRHAGECRRFYERTMAKKKKKKVKYVCFTHQLGIYLVVLIIRVKCFFPGVFFSSETAMYPPPGYKMVSSCLAWAVHSGATTFAEIEWRFNYSLRALGCLIKPLYSNAWIGYKCIHGYQHVLKRVENHRRESRGRAGLSLSQKKRKTNKKGGKGKREKGVKNKK